MTATFDNTQANAEGWGVFSTDDPERPFQLYKLDEEDRFGNDELVWAHVYQRTISGSEYHRAALLFIKEHSPVEYSEIVEWVSRNWLLIESLARRGAEPKTGGD